MNESRSRLFGGLALLALIWVGVYWWWEPAAPSTPLDAPITFDHPPAAAVVEPVTRSEPVAPPPTVAVRNTAPATAEPPPRETRPPAPTSPRPAPAVIPPEFREYTVRAGDTYASIAERELGSSRFASAISRANPFVDPTRLRVGRVIRIPLDPNNIQGKPVEGEQAPTPAPAPETIEYTVKSGDTLSGIAKSFFGSEAFADAIFEANRDRLTSRHALKIGQKLRIPNLSRGADGPN